MVHKGGRREGLQVNFDAANSCSSQVGKFFAFAVTRLSPRQGSEDIQRLPHSGEGDEKARAVIEGRRNAREDGERISTGPLQAETVNPRDEALGNGSSQ